MDSQPFYVVVRPLVNLPYSIFDRDNLQERTSLDKPQSTILLACFENGWPRLELFHYTIAVSQDLPLDLLADHFSSNAMVSPASDYVFLNATLKEIVLFITSDIKSKTVRAFANWLYYEVNGSFPQLLSDYTIVPHKDKTFSLQKE